MTERGGGPPTVHRAGAVPIDQQQFHNVQLTNEPMTQYQQHHQYQQQQLHQTQANMQQFATPLLQTNSYNNGGSSTQNSSNVNNQQLKVNSDFKMMNLTQAQIKVSKMIQQRDSEAASKALEMSKQVQSNTLNVRDQIARIQQQVAMQKEKAKAQAQEQLHQVQSVSIAALQYQKQSNMQQAHYNQNQQDQILQRNPLSGSIQMNPQNQMAKPMQRPKQANNLQQHQEQQDSRKQQIPIHHQAQLNMMQVDQRYQPAPLNVQQPQQQQQQFLQQNSISRGAISNPSAVQGNLETHMNGQVQRKANQSELVQHTRQQPAHGPIIKQASEGNPGAPGPVIRISKKQSGYAIKQKAMNQSPAQLTSKVVKLKAPQVQTMNGPKQIQRQNHMHNQEQGQLQDPKKNIDSNRVRHSILGGSSQLTKQQQFEMQRQQDSEARKKVGSGLKSFDTQMTIGQDQQRAEDIMPAQQSNGSAAAMLYNDEEGRTQEIPRQSVLSNLLQSSISNFQNEESGEDDATNNLGEIDTAVNAKNQIRIEKQAGKSHTRQQYNNLKSRKSRKEDKRKKESHAVNVASRNDDQAEKSSTNKRKDIDSDNKSDISDDSNGAKIKANKAGGKGKRSSLLAKNRAVVPSSPGAASVPQAAQAAPGEGGNAQEGIEIRGVETIEEFFRPEFAQNTQSLDDINDDSEDDEQKGNGEKKQSKLKRSSALQEMGPFPNFSDNSSSSNNSEVDIAQDQNKAQFRNMGFPNMNYLDPDAQGPPLLTQTYYRNYEDNQDNDVKAQREEFSNAREQIPNNTFIKLFHFLNAEAEGGGNQNGENDGDMGDDGHGKQSKQDELQSIQYVDQNFVESCTDTDMEAGLGNFQRQLGSPQADVRIIYNPAKNKSKSLGRVGITDQLNHFQSMNREREGGDEDPNSQLRQRKGSMLGGISDAKMNQSLGRRHRIKANSSEKLPPLLSNKNIANTELGTGGSRKRLLQQSDGNQSDKGGPGGHGPASRQKMPGNPNMIHDSHANIFLKQNLGNDLLPINFEIKQRGKPQLGGDGAKARLNGNLSTINGQQHLTELGPEQQLMMKNRHENQLKSSSNPSLRGAKNQAHGRSGSVNVELNKHSISVSNQVAGTKHAKMSFMTSDHNLQHHHGVDRGFLSPQQANPPTDQEANLPPILKNQENYFSRNGAGLNSTSNDPKVSNADSNQKHFGMMHKRIENQHHYHGVFSGNSSKQQPFVNQHSNSMQQVSNFLHVPQQQVNQLRVLSNSNSPTSRNGHELTQAQFFNNSSDRRVPIKAFPTPSNAIGNILGFNTNAYGEVSPKNGNINNEAEAEKLPREYTPTGEDEMENFVYEFESAAANDKPQQQILSLKKIRLHHKVLAKVSFNAYKFLIDSAEVVKVKEGESLFNQGTKIDTIYFVLYGALMVTIQNANKQRVGDVVRGGNVLGEEAFFIKDPQYKETAVCHSERCGLLAVNAVMLSELGMTNFQGKGSNMLAFQRDFRALFQVLKDIHGTKEAWRNRALSLLNQQASHLQQSNATVANPLGEGFTEYRSTQATQGKGSKYNNK